MLFVILSTDSMDQLVKLAIRQNAVGTRAQDSVVHAEKECLSG